MGFNEPDAAPAVLPGDAASSGRDGTGAADKGMCGGNLAGVLRERPEVYDEAGQYGDQQYHEMHKRVAKE